MTHLKCAAVKIQKVVCGFVVRRILQQAAAQTKEEEAAKKASGPGKTVLRDKGLSDQALFAKRSERKARKAKAKAEKKKIVKSKERPKQGSPCAPSHAPARRSGRAGGRPGP